MEFAQSLDPSKLILAETILSFAVSPFAAPPYNLAIFLFGTYAQENSEALHSVQMFTGILGASTLLDMVWISQNNQHGFIRLLTIIILILKIPTVIAFGISLRQRGTNFRGLGGHDLSGPTVWSMPGGFTSSGGEGYQSVDEERPIHNPRLPVPPSPHPVLATPVAYQSA